MSPNIYNTQHTEIVCWTSNILNYSFKLFFKAYKSRYLAAEKIIGRQWFIPPGSPANCQNHQWPPEPISLFRYCLQEEIVFGPSLTNTELSPFPYFCSSTPPNPHTKGLKEHQLTLFELTMLKYVQPQFAFYSYLKFHQSKSGKMFNSEMREMVYHKCHSKVWQEKNKSD